LITVIY